MPPPARRRSWVWVALAGGLTVLLVTGVVLTALLRGAFIGADHSPAGARGASSSSGPPGVAAVGGVEGRRIAGIRASLGAMTDGLRARSEETFLSAVDPRQPAVMTRQRTVYRSLAALPLLDPDYSWAGDDLEPVAAPAIPDAVEVKVEFRYRLRGWDALTAHPPMAFTFAPVGNQWLVVADTAQPDGSSVGPFAEPWASGRSLVVEQRRHVLVLGDAARRADVRRLATNLERVVADVRRLWPEPSWNGTVVAYAVTDRRFVAEWFGDQAADGRRDDPGGVPSFEARVVSLPGAAEPDGTRRRGPTRLVVTPYLLRQSDAYSISVLRHEVTHVATDHLGRYPPAWLLEGAAEYTGFRLGGKRVDAERTFGRHGVPPATAKAMQRGTWRPVLVTDPRQFYQGSSKAVEAAYIDSWIAALYVADRYGDATLRRLYRTAAAQPESASWAEVEAVALRTVLQTDRERFTAAVRAYGIDLRKRFA